MNSDVAQINYWHALRALLFSHDFCELFGVLESNLAFDTRPSVFMVFEDALLN